MRLKPLRKPSIILKKSKKHGWVLEKGASPQSTSHADGVPIPPLPREREGGGERGGRLPRRSAASGRRRSTWWRVVGRRLRLGAGARGGGPSQFLLSLIGPDKNLSLSSPATAAVRAIMIAKGSQHCRLTGGAILAPQRHGPGPGPSSSIVPIRPPIARKNVTTQPRSVIV
jgi:hypothetical protein